MPSALKQKAEATIAKHAEQLFRLSRQLHDDPELGYAEFNAVASLTSFLQSHGFDIEKGIGGLETAFRAATSPRGERPKIGLIAEYDALPGVGHGCGHNLIAAGAAAAAIGLNAVMDRLGGTLQVYGTPAEENTEDKQGKIRLLEAGTFSDVDACLMFHPWTETRLVSGDLGFITLRGDFAGKSAHAAADPWHGLNAVDGAVVAYTAISTLRQQIKPDSRIHCLLDCVAQAINVIPESASLRVMLRSPNSSYLSTLNDRLEYCLRGAALATGTQCHIERLTWTQPSCRNATLEELVRANMLRLGTDPGKPYFWPASSDLGNVSQVVPSIYFLVKTHEPGVNWHSAVVAAASVSNLAHEGMLFGASVLAATCIDILAQPGLIAQIREDFVARCEAD